jgi:hypothetical protein
MKPKKRQKMCGNCEGEIDLDVIVCPYCAADLREEKPEQQRPSLNARAEKNLGKTMDSLYPSSFPQPKIQAEGDEIQEVAAPVMEEEEGKEKNILGPTILFTLGVQLCLFGLLMVLFSHKGVMVLKWDARLWFLYVFASIPLLIFGYRSLSKL